MEIHYLLYDLVTASVFILNIFVAGIFILRNFNISLMHKLISILLFLLFFRLFCVHLHFSGHIISFPHMLLISHLVSKIGLPLLFLMVFYEVQNRKFKWHDTLHAIPAILYLVNFSNILFLGSAEKLVYVQNIIIYGYDYILDKGLFFNEVEVYVLSAAPFLFYFFAIGYILIKKHHKLTTWLKYFLVAILIYMGINFLPVLFTKVFNVIDTSDLYATNLIFFAATFFMLIYFFFVPNFLYRSHFIKSIAFGVQYKNDSNDEAMNLEQLFETIEIHFRQTLQFTDTTLTIAKVSEILNIPSREISKTIKYCKNQNFSQYINESRINYLLEGIKNNYFDGDSISDIAYGIGFNSINNFYAYFKAIVGCTPRVYLDNLKSI